MCTYDGNKHFKHIYHRLDDAHCSMHQDIRAQILKFLLLHIWRLQFSHKETAEKCTEFFSNKHV